MGFKLFSRVALSVDIPEHGLKAGDVATVVDIHAAGARTGYSLELFNALGDTIAVVVVDEAQIELLREDEILHARLFDKIAA